MKNASDSFARPRVSVIMPAYNVESYIEEAIMSILNQSYTQFELLISDDASTDRTINLITQFTDQRIKVIKQDHNLGYVGNMNYLLKAAQGDYIMIQDADDYAHATRIAVLLDYLESNPSADMVGSSYYKVTESGKQELKQAIVDQTFIQKAFDAMIDPLPVVNGTLMFRRGIIDAGLLFRDLKYVDRGQDDDWLFRVSEQFMIANVSSAIYYYRSNESSMTLNPIRINYKSICAAEYVRFLKLKRVSGEGDFLAHGKWPEIELFFQQAKGKFTSTNRAYIESYIAHRYLAFGDRVNGLKWLFKALIKNPRDGFFWKKIIHVLIHRHSAS